MGLGSTAKKLQKVAEVADQLYSKVNELKTQLEDLRGTVETTNERVDEMDAELAQQRALLEAIAAEQGVDVDDVLAESDAGDAAEASAPSSTE